MTLHLRWLEAKELERQATERRRMIEDELIKQLCISETQEGVTTATIDNYTIKITSRLNRKVDTDLLQQIAAENGLDAHLSTLFRWSADLSVKSWKQADPAITGPLSAAITVTPGRPSFAITKE